MRITGNWLAGWPLGKGHAAVDLGEWDAHGNRRELEIFGEIIDYGQEPASVGLSHEAFDQRLILGDQDVLLKRRNLPVMSELGPAII